MYTDEAGKEWEPVDTLTPAQRQRFWIDGGTEEEWDDYLIAMFAKNREAAKSKQVIEQSVKPQPLNETIPRAQAETADSPMVHYRPYPRRELPKLPEKSIFEGAILPPRPPPGWCFIGNHPAAEILRKDPELAKQYRFVDERSKGWKATVAEFHQNHEPIRPIQVKKEKICGSQSFPLSGPSQGPSWHAQPLRTAFTSSIAPKTGTPSKQWSKRQEPLTLTISAIDFNDSETRRRYDRMLWYRDDPKRTWEQLVFPQTLTKTERHKIKILAHKLGLESVVKPLRRGTDEYRIHVTRPACNSNTSLPIPQRSSPHATHNRKTSNRVNTDSATRTMQGGRIQKRGQYDRIDKGYRASRRDNGRYYNNHKHKTNSQRMLMIEPHRFGKDILQWAEDQKERALVIFEHTFSISTTNRLIGGCET